MLIDPAGRGSVVGQHTGFVIRSRWFKSSPCTQKIEEGRYLGDWFHFICDHFLRFCGSDQRDHRSDQRGDCGGSPGLCGRYQHRPGVPVVGGAEGCSHAYGCVPQRPDFRLNSQAGRGDPPRYFFERLVL